MPYVKIEPSGVQEHRGLVQVRFVMYLEPGEFGYDIHHLQTPTKEWITNPFHNHFVYVEPSISDEELMDMGESFLLQAYDKWAKGERIDCQNTPPLFWNSVDPYRLAHCQRTVQHLQDNHNRAELKRSRKVG